MSREVTKEYCEMMLEILEERLSVLAISNEYKQQMTDAKSYYASLVTFF